MSNSLARRLDKVERLVAEKSAQVNPLELFIKLVRESGLELTREQAEAQFAKMKRLENSNQYFIPTESTDEGFRLFFKIAQLSGLTFVEATARAQFDAMREADKSKGSVERRARAN
ncbi:MAG TPA: hypothetical protein VLR90_01600 [Blastocatellia bacterium]|nr:hypothetical protein [Blastocatellia bacterium]